jgi:hypothetical protein
MFEDVSAPKMDEMFRFAAIIVASIFVIITVAVSYEITRLIS